jgi:hypothetical protein
VRGQSSPDSTRRAPQHGNTAAGVPPIRTARAWTKTEQTSHLTATSWLLSEESVPPDKHTCSMSEDTFQPKESSFVVVGGEFLTSGSYLPAVSDCGTKTHKMPGWHVGAAAQQPQGLDASQVHAPGLSTFHFGLPLSHTIGPNLSDPQTNAVPTRSARNPAGPAKQKATWPELPHAKSFHLTASN